MNKYINQSQIIGEKGVAAFYNYCSQHTPFIIFREESKNDFGVDGEIEFTRTDENGRKIVTGEILKVQIKSTERGSYISNETDSTFEFKARNEDIEYWRNHKIGVVLIIYWVNEKKLYARKISEIDYVNSRTRRNVIITFDKKENLLIDGDNQFNSKYSNLFRDRIDYDTKEMLYTNILEFSVPKYIYAYDSKISNIKDIYNLNLYTRYPIFVMYGTKIYTFIDLQCYPDFINKVLKNEKKETFSFKRFLNEKDKKNWGIELINKYFKDYCSEKGIWYNRDLRRYYFAKLKSNSIVTETRSNYVKQVFRKERNRSKRDRETEKEVVAHYSYYEKVSFYRHVAFEIGYFYDGHSLFLSITPKYFFTSDGKNVLENKEKVTQYTNYLTSREFNQQVLNQIYFIVQYLTNNEGEIVLSDYENCIISLSKLIRIQVPFGIPNILRQTSQKRNLSESQKYVQKNLF